MHGTSSRMGTGFLSSVSRTHNEPSQQKSDLLKFKLAQRANFKSAMMTKLKSRERSKTSHSGVQGNDLEGEISKR